MRNKKDKGEVLLVVRLEETEYDRLKRLHPIRMWWEAFKLAAEEWLDRL